MVDPPVNECSFPPEDVANRSAAEPDLASPEHCASPAGRYPPAPSRPDLPLPRLEGEKLASVIQQIPIGVAITTMDGRIEYVNPYLSALIGLDSREAAGLDLGAFRPKGAARALRRIKQRLLCGNSCQRETQIRKKTGGLFHVLESIYAMRGEDGAITHFIHFMQDISGQKLAAALRHLAFHDSLTGLPNRNLLQDRLNREIAAAQRKHTGFAVIYIDIDRFKEINDTWGHDAGDAILRAVASRLRSALRRSDTLARLGGDEFVAVLENAGKPAFALSVAEKLLAACVRPCRLNGHPVTVSIGISLYPQHARTAEALLKCADSAMYQAKAAGRNTYRLSEPGTPIS